MNGATALVCPIAEWTRDSLPRWLQLGKDNVPSTTLLKRVGLHPADYFSLSYSTTTMPAVIVKKRRGGIGARIRNGLRRLKNKVFHRRHRKHAVVV